MILAQRSEAYERRRDLARRDVVSVAFDDTFIYASRIVHGGEVSRFPKAGGAARVIATALPDEISVAVDETHAYLGGATWLPRSTKGRGLVARVPKGGGKMDVLAQGRDAARDVFLDAMHVYWGEGRWGYPGRVMRAPKGGGSVEVVHEDSTFERAWSDGPWIYVMSHGTFGQRSTGVEQLMDAALWRFPKAGSLAR